MRLRQIALVSSDLDAVTAALETVFGLMVAYNDPGVAHYGLKNAVMSAGDGFLEVVQPVAENASAGRFLAKRCGDAGYMVIVQSADAAAHRARILDLGVRVVDDIDTRTYRASHFHPLDTGGMLLSIDEQRTAPDYLEPFGDWMPAGKDWRDTRTDIVTGLEGITLAGADPAARAALWSRLMDVAPDPADPLRLELARGEIRFAKGEGPLTWITHVDLRVADPAAALERARAAGLPVADGAVTIGGVGFRPVS